MRIVSFITAVLISHSAAADLSEKQLQEIEHLRSLVKSSACIFNRNGEDHDAIKALEHIDRKYAYVDNFGLVDNAEDFIEYSASESSISGKKYTVRCDGETFFSEDWLKQELQSYRNRQLHKTSESTHQ